MNNTVQKKDKCFVCKGTEWYLLPNPIENKSVTTSGVFVNESLGKSQCTQCGFVQRTEHPFLGLTDFYEKNYTSYYTRPGQDIFNKSRYTELSSWVTEVLGDFNPSSIIEVGCGIGWTMQEIKKQYPTSKIKGIEPSEENSKAARELGLDVVTGKMNKDIFQEEKFDLVFSNHVLQHTTDPISFLIACKEILSDNGLILITLQDGRIPQSEILYSDQNFSFLPEHLLSLGNQAGLKTISWRQAPNTDALFSSQVIVYGKKDSSYSFKKIKDDSILFLNKQNKKNLEFLFSKRCEYLNAWKKTEEFLIWKTNKNDKVFNFGAGLYSYLLACYAPEYWKKVEACLVDNIAGKFIDKHVIPFGDNILNPFDCIVLGTRPLTHRVLREKLQNKHEVISWDNFISW
jgi:SAM-dependent methyltransferase